MGGVNEATDPVTVPILDRPLVEGEPPGLHKLVVCPCCGFDHTHPVGTFQRDGQDDYKAFWGGRGSASGVVMVGECGSRFEIGIGNHKGQSYTFCRVYVDCGKKG